MKKLLLLLSLASALFSAQIVQNESTNNLTMFNNDIFGQSFTATGDENMVSVDLAFDTAVLNGITLRVYNGQTNCDTPPGSGNPTAGAIISTTPNLSTIDTNPPGGGSGDLSVTNGYTTLTLGTPVALINGQQYTFCVENHSGGNFAVALSNGNPYADGQMYNRAFAFAGIPDLGFRVNVPAAGTAVPLSKPTLIFLALAFLTIGLYGTRLNKRRA